MNTAKNLNCRLDEKAQLAYDFLKEKGFNISVVVRVALIDKAAEIQKKGLA